MIVADTNILVRVFVKDNVHQSELVYELFRHAQSIYITAIVQVEFFWVLKQSAKFTKPKLIEALEMLQDNSSYILESPTRFSNALQDYIQGNADFSDYLILAKAKKLKVDLWTFDKKLGNHNQANLLTNRNLQSFIINNP